MSGIPLDLFVVLHEQLDKLLQEARHTERTSFLFSGSFLSDSQIDQMISQSESWRIRDVYKTLRSLRRQLEVLSLYSGSIRSEFQAKASKKIQSKRRTSRQTKSGKKR